jgi:hypothetical protein
MKKRVLYVSDKKLIWDAPYNAGIDNVLANRGRLEFETADASDLTDGQRKDIYFQAATSTAKTKHRIRNVFSSNRGEPGIRLGLQVPAMLLFSEDGTVDDVFPHFEGGKYVTIADALALGPIE